MCTHGETVHWPRRAASGGTGPADGERGVELTEEAGGRGEDPIGYDLVCPSTNLGFILWAKGALNSFNWRMDKITLTF